MSWVARYKTICIKKQPCLIDCLITSTWLFSLTERTWRSWHHSDPISWRVGRENSFCLVKTWGGWRKSTKVTPGKSSVQDFNRNVWNVCLISHWKENNNYLCSKHISWENKLSWSILRWTQTDVLAPWTFLTISQTFSKSIFFICHTLPRFHEISWKHHFFEWTIHIIKFIHSHALYFFL